MDRDQQGWRGKQSSPHETYPGGAFDLGFSSWLRWLSVSGVPEMVQPLCSSGVEECGVAVPHLALDHTGRSATPCMTRLLLGATGERAAPLATSTWSQCFGKQQRSLARNMSHKKALSLNLLVDFSENCRYLQCCPLTSSGCECRLAAPRAIHDSLLRPEVVPSRVYITHIEGSSGSPPTARGACGELLGHETVCTTWMCTTRSQKSCTQRWTRWPWPRPRSKGLPWSACHQR